MDERNLWDFEKDSFLFSGLSDHSDRRSFSRPFEVEEKVKKHTVTNVGPKSLEINTPISTRMSDHNLRNAINQCNKNYNNKTDVTIVNHSSVVTAHYCYSTNLLKVLESSSKHK